MDRLHGDFDPARVKDVDLAFYDPLDAADGVATWPETATAVAVRLCVDDSLEVLAPCGVADLLGGVCRRNPRRVTVEEYQRRVVRKGVAQRWPKVVFEP